MVPNIRLRAMGWVGPWGSAAAQATQNVLAIAAVTVSTSTATPGYLSPFTTQCCSAWSVSLLYCTVAHTATGSTPYRPLLSHTQSLPRLLPRDDQRSPCGAFAIPPTAAMCHCSATRRVRRATDTGTPARTSFGSAQKSTPISVCWALVRPNQGLRVRFVDTVH